MVHPSPPAPPPRAALSGTGRVLRAVCRLATNRATGQRMSKKRQRLPLDERRDQLLDIGLELFTASTYEAVSIDDIAAAAKVSKGLLYHYFGGKRAFYVACVRRAASHMVEAVRPDLDLPPPIRAWTGLNAYLDFVHARSRVFSGILQGGQGVDEEVAAIIAETRLRFAEQLLEGTGVPPTRPVFRFAARSYVGAVEAASLAWLEDPELPRSAVVYTMLSALVAIMQAAATLDPEAGFTVDGTLQDLVAALPAGALSDATD